MVEGCKCHHRRRKRRKSDIKKYKKNSVKLASFKREQESRDTRTRRRINGAGGGGGSLSSHGSATGIQCGLCAVLTGLFRRALCIAGSRRGSGESCYQELTCDNQQQDIITTTTTTNIQEKTCNIVVSVVLSTPEKTSSSTSPTTTTTDENNKNIHIIQFETSNAEVTVDSSKQNAVFVRKSDATTLLESSGSSPLPPPSSSPSDINNINSRRYSDTDRQLIENIIIDTNENSRIRNGSRFLTMHKRRRKRLTTRSLNQEPGLLDDIFHGQVQCVLQRAGHWRFNAFTLETVSGGRSLPVLCVHLFQWYGLLKQFQLDVVRVWKLFALIEEGYHSTNPYHNSIHATDVTQAMHCFLQEEKIRKHLTSLEIMASLIAAVTHDLDHPGVNQPFLVATSNHLAKLYENTSVLENHHWRSAIACLLESGVSEQLSPEIRPELQGYISSLILATDITRQQEFLTKFKSYQDNNILDMKKCEYRHFILQISLKCADISNPCRPWDISRKWSYKVCEEFFRQGDYERQLNLPVTPLCDRQTISIPKIQSGFFQFVVTPLYNEWNRFLGDGLSIILMKNLKSNQQKWENLIAQETIDDVDDEDDNNKTDQEEIQNSQISEDPPDVCCAIDNTATLQEEEEEEGEESYSIDIQFHVFDKNLHKISTSSSSRRSSLPYNYYDKKLTGRRHSVPMSIKPQSSSSSSSSSKTTATPLPLVKLDNQSCCNNNKLSSLSLLSSHSSLIESITNTNTNTENERPVSAENLLPETSIASITSSIEASRLSSVLSQSQTTKQLTRQQTFPPLQPYNRIRYLSTTAEMSKCKIDVLHETPQCSQNIEANQSHSSSKTTTPPPPPLSTTPDKKRERKISTRSYTIDHHHHHHHHHHSSGKRRESSAYADFNRLNVDSAFIGNERRRHSLQGVKSDELPLSSRHHKHHNNKNNDNNNNKNKNNISSSSSSNSSSNNNNNNSHYQYHKRPSSAQETDSTQVIYATLTGVTTFKHKSICSESIDISLSQSNVSLEESAADEEQKSTDKFMPLPADNNTINKLKETESLRRFSTPINNDSKIGFIGREKSGRRFTMIPVTSELPIQKVFFIGSPPESPPRHKSISSSSDSGSEQRKSIGETCSEPISYYKSSKIQKMSDDDDNNNNNNNNDGDDDERMKENVDPRVTTTDEAGKFTTGRRVAQGGWARRRGSAPVGLMFRLDDGPLTVTSRIDRHMRRGSVPADIANQTFTSGGSFRSALGIRGEKKTSSSSSRRSSLPPEAAFVNILGNTFLPTDERENNNNINQGMPSPRRGSVPADISELRRDLFGRSSINNKSQQRNRKKTLRRRSSGGPEMFSICINNTDDNDLNAKWSGWKREFLIRDSIPEPSVKRRGSLPVEMLSISHAGNGGGGGGVAGGAGTSRRRSSLWRL
ncbi:uncharacterized protein LOC122851187 isoform X2 [Aphidius gifuensis]|uniref:uncharacterized protein LOC122851187 isoform X2 n=1 Tax=Aphidius gifuensis TaxID=684658 RepID=UPI001CDC60DC|nr:uncharacterized protein LOC122851187 isoform X2 [Aphidius gifuensis]